MQVYHQTDGLFSTFRLISVPQFVLSSPYTGKGKSAGLVQVKANRHYGVLFEDLIWSVL